MSQNAVAPVGRSVVFTTVCVALAAAAHTWMSGSALPVWAVLVGTALVFGTARLAAGSERSLAAIGTLMGLDQTILHFAFTAAQQHATAVAALPGSASPPGTGQTQMPGMPGMPGMPSAGMSIPGMTMPTMSATTLRMTPGMLLAHAAAALLCAWWLRRGEAMVHSLASAVAAWVAEGLHMTVLGRRPVVSRPVACGVWSAPTVSAGGLLRFTVARRGPPRI
jgi:hypothetical protein